MRVLLPLALGTLLALPVRAQEAAQPNVLFVVLDDLNDWVGALGGHPEARTPNIDRLAAEGVLFTNAHSPAPICNPARVAVLTGVPPHRSGLYANRGKLRKVLPDALTLPQALRGAGYTTLGAGKVFHDADPDSWEQYFPSLRSHRIPPPRPETTPANGMWFTGNLDWAAMELPAGAFPDRQAADWIAARLVGGRGEELQAPFFLACGFSQPHVPWYLPADSFERVPMDPRLPETRLDDLADIPAAGRDIAAEDVHEKIVANGRWGPAVQGYLAAIAFADEQVGLLLDALAQSPFAENTIVVLWSDQGFHMGEKQHWKKSSLWEEATRVPLLIAGPGVPRGVRCDRAVSLMDLYPTLLELCGAPARDDIAGESLVPLLRDVEAPREGPVLTTFGFENHAVRSDRWRYVRYADGGEELYDHEVDPHEFTNLAAAREHAAIKAELARWLPEVNAEPAR